MGCNLRGREKRKGGDDGEMLGDGDDKEGEVGKVERILGDERWERRGGDKWRGV